MTAYAACRYCAGRGCLACDAEATRADAPPLTVVPLLGMRDPLVVTHPTGNPCVAVFGPGPDGATCATCCHLHVLRYSGTYFKCDLRPHTSGPGTDHRKRWPACAKYAEGMPTQHRGTT